MTDRLRPHRLGIVGLYEYADQVFCAEDGRLALRGRNTSGKSKALELLVPFVLDGDITPRKLDPFASSAKTMRWNLIECTDAHPERRADKRIGYVWAEFTDGERWVTCGIGLEATRGTDGVRDRWFFTTRQRVGAELTLTRAVGDDAAAQPVVKRDLAEQLAAGGGALHDGPGAYKEALRRELLPFATPALYEQMLEVIRQLRKPKLSESLNAAGLSAMLSHALPAIDEALIRRLGDALEQLHEMQRQVTDLGRARATVAQLAGREYRSYARAVVGRRAERLRAADAHVERTRGAARSAGDAHAAARAAREAADTAVGRLEAARTRADAAYDQLVRSKAFEVVAVLDDRTREREEALARRDAALAARDAARGRADAATAAHAAEQEAVSVAGAARDEALGRLGSAVGRAGLDPVPAQRRALSALPGRVAVRLGQVERALELTAAAADAGRALEALAGPLAEAGVVRDRRAAALAEAEAQAEAAGEQVVEALEAWREGLLELELSVQGHEGLVARALEGEPLEGAVAGLAAGRAQALVLRAARLDAALDAARAAETEAAARVGEIAAQRDPAPAAPPGRADRTGRDGAPLWAVCDFAPGLTDPGQRALLEAALEQSGLLDAWIGPQGAVFDDDVVLAAGPAATAGSGSLADLLVAAPGDHPLDAATIEAVLRSVPLDGVVSVGPGRFAFGPLHGRASKPAAQFLGAAARAAHRRDLLAAAEAQLAAAERTRRGLEGEREQVAAARQRLDRECAAVPSVAAVASAHAARRRTAERLADAESQLAVLVAERDRRDRAAVAAREAADAFARESALPAGEPALRDAMRALDRVELLVAAALEALDGHAAAVRRADQAGAAAQQAGEALAAAMDALARASEQLAGAEGRLEAAQAAGGEDAEQLRRRSAALRAERDRLDEQLRAQRGTLVVAAEAVKDAEAAAADAAAAVEHAEADRVVALDDVRALGRHDLLRAAVGEQAPPDEAQSGGWTLTAALERVRALPDLRQDAEADVEGRARRVAAAVSGLQRHIHAFEMDAATVPTDGLTVVELVRDGRRLSPPGMLAELDADLAHREQVLSERRREVLGKALLGEIAEHLRQLIVGVRASVRSRNETLRRCPTGAGRTVSLAWEVDEDRGAPRAVLELLADRSAANLPEADRETLFAFLESRIADAREGADLDGQATAIVDHLTAALDYRRWHRFALVLHEPDGTRRRLTARSQGLGSGGEQSVLMHLPLFATAAALYDLAPGCPRIVALDEAMDGIDPMTREQIFALLVELDLDWVMTSYDLNPCVATVPRVGFYELHRENAEWGVWAQHFVWDGRAVAEVVDG